MKIKNTTRYFLLGTILLLASLLASPNLQAAIFDVDRTDDDVTATACTAAANDCSLRGAIAAANAAPDVDVINVPAGLYVISIATTPCEDANANGDLDIRESVTISGAGAGSTIVDANDIDRVFDIIRNRSNPIAVVIEDLTVRNGTANLCGAPPTNGGGIRNGEAGVGGNAVDLTLNNVEVTENTVDIDGGDGGGIYNAVNFQGDAITLVINESTISDNSIHGPIGGDGGGIASLGELTVINSTISGNDATGSGGGISICDPGNAELRNVTISDNTADADNTGGGDGGGIANPCDSPAFFIRNTIIAGNFDNSQAVAAPPIINPDCSDLPGNNITSEGYNLIGIDEGCNVPNPWVASDQVGTAASPIDPLLDPLANYGGPTETHQLQATSPAVDRANDVQGCTSDDAMTAVLANDQRGEPRPIDGDDNGSVICDIGAYELQREPECGDGVVDPGEECDDGTANSDTEPDACRTDCTLPDCGDGVVDTNEQCDDGNTADGDGCSSDCQIEEGLIYIQGDRGFSQFNCSLIADGGFSSNHLLSILLMLTGFVGILFVARRRKT